MDQRKSKLIEEQRIGQEKKDVFDKHIRPFLAEREAELFRAFCEVSASNSEALVLIKMQHSVLRALESDFVQYINAGKLASAELESK